MVYTMVLPKVIARANGIYRTKMTCQINMSLYLRAETNLHSFYHLFSSQKVLQFFLKHMHGVLNIDENKK